MTRLPRKGGRQQVRSVAVGGRAAQWDCSMEKFGARHADADADVVGAGDMHEVLLRPSIA
jgi:hypothetical protein